MLRTIVRSILRVFIIGLITLGLTFSNYPSAIAREFAGDSNIPAVKNIFQPFEQPPEAKPDSTGTIDLDVEYADNYIGDRKVHLRSYNGGLVGETIRVSPGDTLKILLDNKLPPCEDAPEICLASKNLDEEFFNVTNLHTHGLHVSPSGDQDNVFLNIKPGDSFTYKYLIPENHPAGTFWYHPHVHQSTAIQTSTAMAGALIVEGGLDDVPEIANAKDLIFVFQQIPYYVYKPPGTGFQPATPYYEVGTGYVEDFDNTFGPGTWDGSDIWEGKGGRTTINGQLVPKITMEVGQLQRWRLIHAGVKESLYLGLCTAELAEECPKPFHPSNLKFYEIANDGIAFGNMVPQSFIELEPGYRSDVLVRIDEPGTYALVDARIASLNSEKNPKRKVLAKIEVLPTEKKPMPFPKAQSLSALAPFDHIYPKDVTGHQELEFKIACVGKGGLLDLPCPDNYKVDFLVDDHSFNSEEGELIGKPPVRILHLGDVEEWTLKSAPPAPHPFHIHVNHFEVITKDEDTGKEHGVWKDTILVKPDEPVTIRTRYEDFTGDSVLHCHILDHEDLGMMQVIRICPKGAEPGTKKCPTTLPDH